MDCLVITRFNLKVKFECPKKDESRIGEVPWLDEEWLDKRFELFENYIFKGFNNQTCKEFEWIVLFHKDTPEKYKKRVDGYKEKFSQFVPLYLDDDKCENWKEFITKYIKDKYKGKILTIRIDSDDYIHKTFIEEMKYHANRITGKRYISFINGIQYDEFTQDVFSQICEKNHFLGMVGNAEKDTNHVYRNDHTEIKNAEIELIKTAIPLWVEVCSRYNYNNSSMWYLKNIYVPYKIRKVYPELDIIWKNRLSWALYMFMGYVMVALRKAKIIK